LAESEHDAASAPASSSFIGVSKGGGGASILASVFRCHRDGGHRDVPPLPLAGEGWGEGDRSDTSRRRACPVAPRFASPHPRLRRDLSRERER